MNRFLKLWIQSKILIKTCICLITECIASQSVFLDQYHQEHMGIVEMQINGPLFICKESETPGVGFSDLYSKKLSRQFGHTLKSEAPLLSIMGYIPCISPIKASLPQHPGNYYTYNNLPTSDRLYLKYFLKILFLFYFSISGIFLKNYKIPTYLQDIRKNIFKNGNKLTLRDNPQTVFCKRNVLDASLCDYTCIIIIHSIWGGRRFY